MLLQACSAAQRGADGTTQHTMRTGGRAGGRIRRPDRGMPCTTVASPRMTRAMPACPRPLSAPSARNPPGNFRPARRRRRVPPCAAEDRRRVPLGGLHRAGHPRRLEGAERRRRVVPAGEPVRVHEAGNSAAPAPVAPCCAGGVVHRRRGAPAPSYVAPRPSLSCCTGAVLCCTEAESLVLHRGRRRPGLHRRFAAPALPWAVLCCSGAIPCCNRVGHCCTHRGRPHRCATLAGAESARR